MIKVICIKSDKLVIEGAEYFIGGVISGTNDVVVMSCPHKTVVPGRYDMTKVFGLEKENLLETIKNGAIEAGEAIYKGLKQKGL